MNDLLICAGLVGIEIELEPLQDNNQLVYVDENGYLHDYNPLTNDAQAFELLKVLSEKDIDIRIYGAERVELVNHGTERLWHAGGQTLNEAIIKAVVAMEDTHECNT